MLLEDKKGSWYRNILIIIFIVLVLFALTTVFLQLYVPPDTVINIPEVCFESELFTYNITTGEMLSKVFLDSERSCSTDNYTIIVINRGDSKNNIIGFTVGLFYNRTVEFQRINKILAQNESITLFFNGGTSENEYRKFYSQIFRRG